MLGARVGGWFGRRPALPAGARQDADAALALAQAHNQAVIGSPLPDGGFAKDFCRIS